MYSQFINPAIVLGGSSNAMGHVWALSKMGVQCHVIVERGLHDFPVKSRFCKGHISPHPVAEKEQALAYVKAVVASLAEKPVVFFASDDWMAFFGENEAYFRANTFVPLSPWPDTEKLFNKKYLYRIASEIGIAVPLTLEFNSLREVGDRVNEIPTPCVLKPDITVEFVENLPQKIREKTFHRTQKFEDKEMLLDWVNALLSADVDFSFLVQEFIPGGAETLYTLTSYSNQHGKLVAGSIGHKLRQFPPEAGRITSGILCHNEQIWADGKRLLNGIGFFGLANTEFKYDARTNEYKLMEINARLGMWNSSALYAGINFPAIVYADMFDKKVAFMSNTSSCDGAIWLNSALDFVCAVYLNKKIGYKGALSVREWFKSIKGKKTDGVFKVKDPAPFIFFLVNMFKYSLKKK